MAFPLFRASLASALAGNSRSYSLLLRKGAVGGQHSFGASSLQSASLQPHTHLAVRQVSASPASSRPTYAPSSNPVNFDDYRAAFKHHTTGELLRALFILKLCSFSLISSNSERIVSTLKKYFGKQFTGLAFTLLHRHFAGGERFEDLSTTLDKLEKAGVGAILDYAAEADIEGASQPSSTEDAHTSMGPPLYVDHPFFPETKMDATSTLAERELDANVAIFLESVQAAATRKNGFAAIKVTGLIEPEDLITLARLCKPASDPVLAELPAPTLARLHRCMARLDRIAQASHSGKVRLMVDAEQTYFQPAIDWLVRLMQRKYNTHWPAVFNTYQCYLTDSHARLTADLADCAKRGIKFGAKLVRGAYLYQERERAMDLSYPDPIFTTIDGTHANYDKCAAEVLPHVARGANVMIASHNEHSIAKVTAAMDSLQIPRDGGVFFGQLLGMADHVTFPLGAARYAVYKYVPYGPVYEVVAYLSRRVQENSSVTGGEPIRKARTMLWRELCRRNLFLRLGRMNFGV